MFVRRLSRLICVLALAASPAIAAPPNDECSAPAPISGAGGWNLDDLLTATLSASPPPIPGTLRDAWFCWTPTWNGLAQLDIGTTGQVYAEVYNGCACPGVGSSPILLLGPGLPPGRFQVQCGHRYLLRLAAEQYPWPPVNPVRGFSISKVSGEDCPPLPPQSCPDCCGGKPRFDDPLYTTNYTGQVAVVNQSFVGQFSTGGPIISIFNLGAAPAPIPGAVWDPIPGVAPTAFRYTRPNWDITTLGSCFPLTLDNSGNIYTAYCAATNAPTASSISGSTSGSIFRIPVGTGVPQLFCNIPDNLAPPVGCTGTLIPCSTPNPCPPGIGDVCSDCDHSQFFASAFADGRIYRISPAGVPIDCFDHASNTIQPPARDASNPYTQYIPREKRVWALEVHQGRLYYSIWGQEIGCTAGFYPPGSTPNRIWSVGLTGSGAFIANSRRMELQVPVYPPSSTFGGPFNDALSCPISDISFSGTCKMMLAERPVATNGVIIGAHIERGLEYAWDGGAWIPSFPRNGYGYPIGANPVGLPNTNACGGTDYDFATGGTAAGRAWFTADYLSNSPISYGITGVDPTAPALATAVHVDYGGAYAFEKTKLCDIEIPCVGTPCVDVIDGQLLCTPGVPGNYTWTFQIKNNTTVPIQYILLLGANFIPNIVVLGSPLLPTQTSGPLTVTLTGLVPGQVFCFNMTFADPTVNECCRVNHCLRLPDCDCLQLPLFRAECYPGNPNAFQLTFTVQNLSTMPVNELYIFPPIGSGVTVNPNYFTFPPLTYGQTSGPMSTFITGAIPGQQLCLRFSIHVDGEECCSEEICFTVPQPCLPGGMPLPCTPGALCYADCDGNNLLTINDFACYMNNFAAGNGCANCDGSTIAPVLNIADFTCFLNKYAAGCP